MYGYRYLVVLSIAVSIGGCYQTHYVNLQPPSTDASPKQSAEAPASGPQRVRPSSGWQSFFVWGWFPDEKVFYADQICGGSARVQEIQTKQTFLEGLVAAVAGYYVNIYSPYDAQIFCEGDITRP